MVRVYDDWMIKAISADSTNDDVKSAYEGLDEVQSLVDALEEFAGGTLYPAHFAYVAAESALERCAIARPVLLTISKAMLYSAPGPVERRIQG